MKQAMPLKVAGRVLRRLYIEHEWHITGLGSSIGYYPIEDDLAAQTLAEIIGEELEKVKQEDISLTASEL